MTNDLPKIMYDGKINIGNKELSCAVLEDGTRILKVSEQKSTMSLA